jgi:transposase
MLGRPTHTIKLSDSTRQEIVKEIQQQRERKVADRLRVVLYKAAGQTNQAIAALLQMSRTQVKKVLSRYVSAGMSALLAADHYQGSVRKLTESQQQALKVELKTHIYVTAQQVVAWIEQQWQVTYAVSGVQKLLKRLGFTYKKNRLVPSQADPALQQQFVQWYAGLCARLGPNDRIYFGDAAHFKHNAEAGYAWSPSGEPFLIPSNSGRQRYNVLGAYAPRQHECVVLLTADNITQATLVEFLALLRKHHQNPGKLYLLLDNARYNYTQAVTEAARLHHISLDYLPPYSPNLNPIERLWKFVRKHFFKDKYRRTFADFCLQLQKFFANLDPYRQQLASLITDRFELIPPSWLASTTT